MKHCLVRQLELLRNGPETWAVSRSDNSGIVVIEPHEIVLRFYQDSLNSDVAEATLERTFFQFWRNLADMFVHLHKNMAIRGTVDVTERLVDGTVWSGYSAKKTNGIANAMIPYRTNAQRDERVSRHHEVEIKYGEEAEVDWGASVHMDEENCKYRMRLMTIMEQYPCV